MFYLSNFEFGAVIDSFGGFYLLSEVCNYLFCLTILSLFTYFKYVEKEYFLFWSLFFLTPFLFNFLLFEPLYMPDQYTYMKEINHMKAGTSQFQISEVFSQSGEGLKSSRIGASAYFLSFVPMFSFLTISSLAFLNKMLTFFLFIFLNKRIPTGNLVLFFIIPSFILYSSVSLRETLVMAVSCLSLVYLIERKIFLSLLAIFVLGLVKLQNAPGFILAWLLIFICSAHKSYLRLWGLTIIGVCLLIIFFDQYAPIINLYRMAWAVEDGYSIQLVDQLEILSGFELVWTAIIETPKFLLKPFIWQVTNPLQLFVTIESLVLLYFLYKFIKKDKFYLNVECQLLLICLLAIMGLYAITVYNYGTIARYRFIGFFPFLIGIYYLKIKTDDSKSYQES